MKKAMILAAVAAAGVCAQANAAGELCASTGGTVTFATAASSFVRTSFNIKCSNNVYSNYAENATAIGIVAGSAKGKNYFGGGTNSGQVTALGVCASTGCSTTEVSNANAQTMRDAS